MKKHPHPSHWKSRRPFEIRAASWVNLKWFAHSSIYKAPFSLGFSKWNYNEQLSRNNNGPLSHCLPPRVLHISSGLCLPTLTSAKANSARYILGYLAIVRFSYLCSRNIGRQKDRLSERINFSNEHATNMLDKKLIIQSIQCFLGI